jgi:selenocysteine-specific elongation factor
MIVATAGHVDHGKTLLVKALTGVDTDRLPDEKRRGLTIDLGFAYEPLEDGHVLGFVDVPGHERFIRNMLAGVAAIDFALLVVAADDGPKPQTVEHLAILDLLGVGRGAVAISKIDRVDPARIEEVCGQVRELLDGSALAGAPFFPLSAMAGEGVEALHAHLRAEAAAHQARVGGGNFRLAVDRCFTVAGAGLVVTGAVFSGTTGVGDRLVLSPQGLAVRVRGLHVHDHKAEVARAGERCALNIAGPDLDREAVSRGDWLLAERAHAPTERIDARIRVLAGEARPLRHWTPAHLHLGAASVTCRVAVLDGRAIAPGGDGLVQLVLDRPIGALRDDRLVLRDQSAQRTMAGGMVVDPFGPTRGRARPERLKALAALERDDPAEALAGLLAETPRGVDLGRFETAWNLDADASAALRARVELVEAGPADARLGFAPGHWRAFGESILSVLAAWHERVPGHLGPDAGQLGRALPGRLHADVLAAALHDLSRQGAVRRHGSLYHLPDHQPVLSPKEAGLWAKAGPYIEAGGLRPPRVHEVAEELGVAPEAAAKMLTHAARLGLVHRVADNRYFPPAAVRELAAIAEALATEAPDGLFDARAYRDRSGIGRNVTIEVLEFFDRAGLTRRRGDGRELIAPAASVFGSAPGN